MRVFRSWDELEKSYLNIDETNFNKLWNNEILNQKHKHYHKVLLKEF